MRYSFVLFCFVFLSFQPDESTAQTQEVKFTRITGTDGITLGKVNGMTRDENGFMWFSDQDNHAMIKYDGSHMVMYQHDPKNPNSLGGFYPECLFSDHSTGFIWVGYYGQGIDRFDPQTNTFIHYRNDPDDPHSLSNDVVSTILVDHLGNIWVGTEGGLNLLNPNTGMFTHYQHNPDDDTSLSHNVVRSLYEDKEGTLWVGTGFFGSIENKGGLNKFNRKTGSFTRYLHDPKNRNTLIDNRVRAIFEDSEGNFWIGTNKNGLHKMDRKSGSFKRVSNGASDSEEILLPLSGSGADHITFIREDAAGKLWIGTHNDGIARYDPVNRHLTHYGKRSLNSGSFHDNSGWWIHSSPEGLLWLSTQESHLYQLDIYNNVIPHFDLDEGALCFYQESPAILWIGTNGTGLIRKNLENGAIKQFVNKPLDVNSISNDFINSIYQDSQGDLWIGTNNGLDQFDPKTQHFTHFTHDLKDVGSSNFISISDVYEDWNSDIWIGSYGDGLYKWTRETKKISHYQNYPADTTTIGSILVLKILGDKKTDHLWVGLSAGGGISKLNIKTEEIKRYLYGLVVRSLFRDSNEILWAGTQNGLYRYDLELDNFRAFNSLNSGAKINSQIWSITEDDDANIWMSSFIGILRLNKDRDQLKVFGNDNKVITGLLGFGGEGVRIFKAQNGMIYIGDAAGYYSFNPKKLTLGVANPPKLLFTDLWINGKLVKQDLLNPEIKNLDENEMEVLQLQHDQGTFSLGFTSLDFRKPQNQKIFYNLENLDNDWHQSNVNDKANYFKVAPGNYRFKIRTANNSDGGWVENGIDITILPPWWLTWWAYSIYGIFFIAAVFIVDRIQRRRLLEKERSRTQQIELEQAREIEKAYTELKTTQTQLIQSEKMASLGELTAGIAHEIQNPLNFVNNFSEVSGELVEEINEEIKAGNLKEVEEITVDLKQNLEKINHHGQRASGIVKGMLEHSRTGTGKKELTDINKLADEYLRLSYHGLRAKDKSFNADFKSDFDETLPEVKVIVQDLGRVILNLINNAFYAVSEKAKAVDDGKYKPVVKVSTRKLNAAVEIIVQDNGQGIPKEIVDKIFQPFFTTKPSGSGTGLGLSLSYDIIKAHGGEMQVESKDGEETKFIIKVPL